MYVRKNGAAAVREIVKQSEELASLVVEASGLGFLIDYMGDCHGNARLPTIMALGKCQCAFIVYYSFGIRMRRNRRLYRIIFGNTLDVRFASERSKRFERGTGK